MTLFQKNRQSLRPKSTTGNMGSYVYRRLEKDHIVNTYFF